LKNKLLLNPKEFIIIQGAEHNNLKDIDVVLPRNQFIVFTGLSGSGKSSLAFDTLYAEGQRRYVESLSSYARQFLGRINKPKVKQIKGIAPAIAIEQKKIITNPRSTVGTKTEIYDYLKLLYSKIGITYSPISGKEVKKDNVNDVINKLKKIEDEKKILLLAPISQEKKDSGILKRLQQQGYARIFYKNKVIRIDSIKSGGISGNFSLVVDRVVVKNDKDFYNRMADAIEIAFFEGKGFCSLYEIDNFKEHFFSNKFQLDGINFLQPTPHLFSFNNPFGVCQKCEGFGMAIGIDPELVIPDTSLSIYDDAIAPWRGEGSKIYKRKLIESASLFDFPIHRDYSKLSKKEKNILWEGNKYFIGLWDFFKKIEAKNYKIQNRVLLARYRSKTLCNECEGSRLRKEALYVKIGNKNILDLIQMSIDDLSKYFNTISLSNTQKDISQRLLKEIKNRLEVLQNVGLGYLTLQRSTNTLSGGESQRISLATSLGSSLVGSMYILDEPSIGLHSRDTARLLKVLLKLKSIGNTVIVVEHDEEIIKTADKIIDIGPMAGTLGGEVVFEGTYKKILASKSITGKYLSNKLQIEIPAQRRKSSKYIEITGACDNNLKNINVKIPLNIIIAITGVSGSGKTTLVKNILYPALLQKIGIYKYKTGKFADFKGDFSLIQSVELIDQNPIGRSSRSNPITYIKAYDEIRNLYAKQQTSKIRGYQPKHFSFNVEGGRCEECKGEGIIKIEMQFMADVILKCENCKGKRFKKELLQVKFQNVSIDELLRMTIDDAITLFEKHQQEKIVKKIKPLQDVGLGYITLGQSSSTLSGGEAQRIKLAYFIGLGVSQNKTLFIFDEPTTGLHFHDIKKLLTSFNALVENGHSIIVIEHNLELIKCADYIIDMGPDAGDKGGEIVAVGKPEEIIKNPKSITGKYLKEKIN